MRAGDSRLSCCVHLKGHGYFREASDKDVAVELIVSEDPLFASPVL